MTSSLRSRTYRALAAALRPPSLHLARAVARGRLRGLLAGALAAGPGTRTVDLHPLALRGSPEVVRELLRAEYCRLFQDPRGRVELAESVYKERAAPTLGGMPWARQRGPLMGEPALHLQALYEQTGFPVPEAYAGRPDHLALELEFMACLVEQHTGADQAQFLANHLDWLPDLVMTAAGWEPAPFYATLLAATRVWIEQERCRLFPAAPNG